ncbi:ankyrin-2-like [Malaya genurostris]|uniref:ankyrin-2-like n=1 Tax=Malaya genurostris TaxID=325434 RepID=UPI0026F385BD|nr:ankyrin-2-like [Malaya genurostris]
MIIHLRAQPIDPDLTAKLLGRGVAVSPVVTVEPRRRKFHKAITLSMPAPRAHSQGMINQYSGNAPTLRLLCSITGGTTRAQWEDVTGSTPLTFVNDCVSFTTTVSARFWLMDCRNIADATKMATELYKEAIHVPFMAKFVVFAKRTDPLEARLRVFCMTDDREDKTLEHQEHFTEVAKSRDVEVLEDKPQYIELAGNLVPITKSGEQLSLPFKAFRENRLPFSVRVKDQHADIVGRTLFMREPKIAKGEPPQQPICILNIVLPETIIPDQITTIEDSQDIIVRVGRAARVSPRDQNYLGELRVVDISNLLGEDWIKLAPEIGVSETDVDNIIAQNPTSSAQQAQAMLKMFQSSDRNDFNILENGLRTIQRDDIVDRCLRTSATSTMTTTTVTMRNKTAFSISKRSHDVSILSEHDSIAKLVQKDDNQYTKEESNKYSVEEKQVDESEESEEETIKRTVAERRKQIEKRLSADRSIPASTQKKEIVEEIITIKRASVIDDTRAKHEEEILMQKPIDNTYKSSVIPEPVVKLKTATIKEGTAIAKDEFDRELQDKFKTTLKNVDEFEHKSQVLTSEKVDTSARIVDEIAKKDVKPAASKADEPKPKDDKKKPDTDGEAPIAKERAPIPTKRTSISREDEIESGVVTETLKNVSDKISSFETKSSESSKRTSWVNRETLAQEVQLEKEIIAQKQQFEELEEKLLKQHKKIEEKEDISEVKEEWTEEHEILAQKSKLEKQEKSEHHFQETKSELLSKVEETVTNISSKTKSFAGTVQVEASQLDSANDSFHQEIQEFAAQSSQTKTSVDKKVDKTVTEMRDSEVISELKESNQQSKESIDRTAEMFAKETVVSSDEPTPKVQEAFTKESFEHIREEVISQDRSGMQKETAEKTKTEIETGVRQGAEILAEKISEIGEEFRRTEQTASVKSDQQPSVVETVSKTITQELTSKIPVFSKRPSPEETPKPDELSKPEEPTKEKRSEELSSIVKQADSVVSKIPRFDSNKTSHARGGEATGIKSPDTTTIKSPEISTTKLPSTTTIKSPETESTHSKIPVFKDRKVSEQLSSDSCETIIAQKTVRMEGSIERPIEALASAMVETGEITSKEVKELLSFTQIDETILNELVTEDDRAVTPDDFIDEIIEEAHDTVLLMQENEATAYTLNLSRSEDDINEKSPHPIPDYVTERDPVDDMEEDELEQEKWQDDAHSVVPDDASTTDLEAFRDYHWLDTPDSATAAQNLSPRASTKHPVQKHGIVLASTEDFDTLSLQSYDVGVERKPLHDSDETTSTTRASKARKEFNLDLDTDATIPGKPERKTHFETHSNQGTSPMTDIAESPDSVHHYAKGESPAIKLVIGRKEIKTSDTSAITESRLTVYGHKDVEISISSQSTISLTTTTTSKDGREISSEVISTGTPAKDSTTTKRYKQFKLIDDDQGSERVERKRDDTVSFSKKKSVYLFGSFDSSSDSPITEGSGSGHVTDTGISLTRGFTETMTSPGIVSSSEEKNKKISIVTDTAVDVEIEELELTDAGLSPILPDETDVTADFQMADEDVHYAHMGTSPVEFEEQSISAAMDTSEAATLTDRVETKDASNSPLDTNIISILKRDLTKITDEELLTGRRGSGDVKAKVKILEQNQKIQSAHSSPKKKVEFEDYQNKSSEIYESPKKQKIATAKINELKRLFGEEQEPEESNIMSQSIPPIHEVIKQLEKRIAIEQIDKKIQDQLDSSAVRTLPPPAVKKETFSEQELSDLETQIIPTDTLQSMAEPVLADQTDEEIKLTKLIRGVQQLGLQEQQKRQLIQDNQETEFKTILDEPVCEKIVCKKYVPGLTEDGTEEFERSKRANELIQMFESKQPKDETPPRSPKRTRTKSDESARAILSAIEIEETVHSHSIIAETDENRRDQQIIELEQLESQSHSIGKVIIKSDTNVTERDSFQREQESESKIIAQYEEKLRHGEISKLDHGLLRMFDKNEHIGVRVEKITKQGILSKQAMLDRSPEELQKSVADIKARFDVLLQQESTDQYMQSKIDKKLKLHELKPTPEQLISTQKDSKTISKYTTEHKDVDDSVAKKHVEELQQRIAASSVYESEPNKTEEPISIVTEETESKENKKGIKTDTKYIVDQQTKKAVSPVFEKNPIEAKKPVSSVTEIATAEHETEETKDQITTERKHVEELHETKSVFPVVESKPDEAMKPVSAVTEIATKEAETEEARDEKVEIVQVTDEITTEPKHVEELHEKKTVSPIVESKPDEAEKPISHVTEIATEEAETKETKDEITTETKHVKNLHEKKTVSPIVESKPDETQKPVSHVTEIATEDAETEETKDEITIETKHVEELHEKKVVSPVVVSKPDETKKIISPVTEIATEEAEIKEVKNEITTETKHVEEPHEKKSVSPDVDSVPDETEKPVSPVTEIATEDAETEETKDQNETEKPDSSVTEIANEETKTKRVKEPITTDTKHYEEIHETKLVSSVVESKPDEAEKPVFPVTEIAIEEAETEEIKDEITIEIKHVEKLHEKIEASPVVESKPLNVEEPVSPVIKSDAIKCDAFKTMLSNVSEKHANLDQKKQNDSFELKLIREVEKFSKSTDHVLQKVSAELQEVAQKSGYTFDVSKRQYPDTERVDKSDFYGPSERSDIPEDLRKEETRQEDTRKSSFSAVEGSVYDDDSPLLTDFTTSSMTYVSERIDSSSLELMAGDGFGDFLKVTPVSSKPDEVKLEGQSPGSCISCTTTASETIDSYKHAEKMIYTGGSLRQDVQTEYERSISLSDNAASDFSADFNMKHYLPYDTESDSHDGMTESPKTREDRVKTDEIQGTKQMKSCKLMSIDPRHESASPQSDITEYTESVSYVESIIDSTNYENALKQKEPLFEQQKQDEKIDIQEKEIVLTSKIEKEDKPTKLNEKFNVDKKELTQEKKKPKTKATVTKISLQRQPLVGISKQSSKTIDIKSGSKSVEYSSSTTRTTTVSRTYTNTKTHGYMQSTLSRDQKVLKPLKQSESANSSPAKSSYRSASTVAQSADRKTRPSRETSSSRSDAPATKLASKTDTATSSSVKKHEPKPVVQSTKPTKTSDRPSRSSSSTVTSSTSRYHRSKLSTELDDKQKQTVKKADKEQANLATKTTVSASKSTKERTNKSLIPVKVQNAKGSPTKELQKSTLDKTQVKKTDKYTEEKTTQITIITTTKSTDAFTTDVQTTTSATTGFVKTAPRVTKTVHTSGDSKQDDTYRCKSAMHYSYKDAVTFDHAEIPSSLPSSPSRLNKSSSNSTNVLTSEVFTRTIDSSKSIEVIYRQPSTSNELIRKINEYRYNDIDLTTDSSLSDSIALPSSSSEHESDVLGKRKRSGSPASPKAYTTTSSTSTTTRKQAQIVSEQRYRKSDIWVRTGTPPEVLPDGDDEIYQALHADRRTVASLDGIVMESRISPILDFRASTPPRLKYKFDYDSSLFTGKCFYSCSQI